MTVLELWLPIVITTVVTFFLSFLAWAILPHHQKDVAFCPEQDDLLDFVRRSNIKPGRYMFPNCADRKDWKDPAVVETYNKGPWGVIDIWPNRPSMGRNMLLTVLSFFVVTIFVAYLTRLANPLGGEDFSDVFQVAATAAALAYILGGLPEGIWFGKRTRHFLTDAFDGAMYALATGLVFAWLWPTAAEVITA